VTLLERFAGHHRDLYTWISGFACSATASLDPRLTLRSQIKHRNGTELTHLERIIRFFAVDLERTQAVRKSNERTTADSGWGFNDPKAVGADRSGRERTGSGLEIDGG
jgi:hypothetical protein